MDDPKQRAPSVARNRDAILNVLSGALPPRGLVLEIASGSGEHVVYFAEALPHLSFQPSDADAGARASVSAWIAESARRNINAPIAIDASAPDWPLDRADAIVCINMSHISPWAATEGLFKGAGRLLPRGAPLILYGPYKRGGAHTAPSNVDFDVWLKSKCADFGVRDLEAVSALGAAAGFAEPQIVDMPANNFCVIFRKA